VEREASVAENDAAGTECGARGRGTGTDYGEASGLNRPLKARRPAAPSDLWQFGSKFQVST